MKISSSRIKEILGNIKVIVDTRENENFHITKYFDDCGISYTEQCLKFGDYSFICPPLPEVGFEEEVSFESRIVIERKANLTELSGNLAQNRERFERELQKAIEAKARFVLMVENGDYQKIIEHKYRTDLKPASYYASLFSFQARYNIDIQFMPSKMAGWFIYNTFKYFLREELVMIKKQLEAVV